VLAPMIRRVVEVTCIVVVSIIATVVWGGELPAPAVPAASAAPPVLAPAPAAPAAAPIAPTPAMSMNLSGSGAATATPSGATAAGAAAPADAAAEAPPAAWPPGLLMENLQKLGGGKPLDTAGIRIWGYFEGGFTGRLTGGQHPLPLMGFESTRPNSALLHQFRLTVDRPYDAAKSVDWGFRVDGLFGSDAFFTHSLGLFQYAGHGTGSEWADLTQFYGQGWFKTGADSGLELTVGKFATPMGAEVIDATGNALFSHSYLFNFAEPFTHTGVKLNYIINPQVSVYVAAVEGADVFDDNNRAWSTMAGTALSSAEQIDGHARASLSLNVMVGPEQTGSVSPQRALVDVVGTYWWTSKLSQTVSFDYAVEQDVPDVGDAHWYGVAHYLTYTINEYASATWRTEWFRDADGVRTGTAANYYENTWGLAITPAPNHPVLKNLVVRPELRWDFADAPAFGGDNHNQLTAGFDVIFKF
jgi:hypothetical protein